MLTKYQIQVKMDRDDSWRELSTLYEFMTPAAYAEIMLKEAFPEHEFKVVPVPSPYDEI